jgi:hypothetical protein
MKIYWLWSIKAKDENIHIATKDQIIMRSIVLESHFDVGLQT